MKNFTSVKDVKDPMALVKEALELKKSPYAHNHLGKNKYSSTVKALRELVANAFDAEATKVNIDLVSNELAVGRNLGRADGFEAQHLIERRLVLHLAIQPSW